MSTERTVILFNNRDSYKEEIKTSAETLQELEYEYSSDFKGLSLTTKEGQALDYNTSVLPEGDFVLFLSPKDSKAGAIIPVIADGGRERYFQFRTFIDLEVRQNEEAAEHFRAREWNKLKWPELVTLTEQWNEREINSMARTSEGSFIFTDDELTSLIVVVQAMNEGFIAEDITEMLVEIINNHIDEEIDFDEIEAERLKAVYRKTTASPR
jgi:hypothetical protein